MTTNSMIWIPVFIASMAVIGGTDLHAASTITFDNQSGKDALVKLVGPTRKSVAVENGRKETVETVAGRYFIKARYGEPGQFTYSKGAEFDVAETSTSYSQITITLHKVIGGNYGTREITEKEFGLEEGAAVLLRTPTPPEASASNSPETPSRSQVRDAKDQVVVDKTKGLMWDKSGSADKMPYKDTATYCGSLKLGGFSDWRLPTIWELSDLYDELTGKGKDHRDPLFRWADPALYWSQSKGDELGTLGKAGGLEVRSGGEPLALDFSSYLIALSGSKDNCYVRAVRGRVSPEYLQKWIKQLHADGIQLKWEGLARIEKITGPEAKEAIPDVKPLLQDPDKRISEKARVVLEKLQR